jgi:bacteriocin biosynthesis cyclodehydratase domain-containing protein
MTTSNSAPPRLTLQPGVELIWLNDTRLQFYGATPTFTVNDGGGHIRALLSWCDGTRTEAEILHLLSARIPDPDKVLAYLKGKNCIVPVTALAPDRFIDYLDLERHTQNGYFERYAHAPVPVPIFGVGELARATSGVLTQLGFDCRPNPENGVSRSNGISIATSDVIDHASFLELNSDAVSAGEPILFCSVDRTVVLLGPLVVPGESACFLCYHHRLRSNMVYRDEFDARVMANGKGREHGNGADPGTQTASGLVSRAASTLIAASVAGYLLQTAALGRSNRLVEFDLARNSCTTHNILKLPRCPTCGLGLERIQQAVYQPVPAPPTTR